MRYDARDLVGRYEGLCMGANLFFYDQKMGASKPIRHVDNVPIIHIWRGHHKNTQSKLYILSLNEYVLEFLNKAFWDALWLVLLHLRIEPLKSHVANSTFSAYQTDEVQLGKCLKLRLRRIVAALMKWYAEVEENELSDKLQKIGTRHVRSYDPFINFT